MERIMKDVDGWYEDHPSLEHDRRSLSGIFIFDRFPGEEEVMPTCFEDCTPMKQEEYIKALPLKSLQEMTLMLSRALKDVGKSLNIEADEYPDQGDQEDVEDIPQN